MAELPDPQRTADQVTQYLLELPGGQADGVSYRIGQVENDPPYVAISLADLGPYEVGVGLQHDINLVNVFRDDDPGDSISLTAVSEVPETFGVEVSSSHIVLTGKQAGTGFVTVTASDKAGASVWASIRINVVQP